ncbi:hypothetical protein H9P43_007385 [Blastocladiella emersonii ATCC 22665]|nr:hypothetical protein H9P43_007369 [Blastocladiella emersonii ATCC 22665]KAI9173254.1 hypothetical protein H9P43_007385 [Blastocladiella emersonii ATCC 22665]
MKKIDVAALPVVFGVPDPGSSTASSTVLIYNEDRVVGQGNFIVAFVPKTTGSEAWSVALCLEGCVMAGSTSCDISLEGAQSMFSTSLFTFAENVELGVHRADVPSFDPDIVFKHYSKLKIRFSKLTIALSSVSFLPNGAVSAIFASHTILEVRSRFFAAKFRGEWVASVANHEPIKLPTWDLAAFAVIVAHLYSRWVPSESSTVPDAVKSALARMGVHLGSFDDFDVLSNCFDLAEFLECIELASALEPMMVAAIGKRVRAMKVAPTKFSPSVASQ